jgi:UDP-GlcNAc:undecaprenyl-phosphate/decaprenyl-phosphate GlcNAc-1-phosphate transferase
VFLPYLHFGATFVLALALALYLTPMVRKGALRFGVLDRPDGALKVQPDPVPYLGGIAVYLAFLLTLGLVFQFHPQLVGLLLGGTIVTMVGLFDDLKVLPAGLKLIGQLLAAWVLWKSNVGINLNAVPEWLELPLTILWMVGITNALNLLDVSDGLTAGVAAISGLGLFAIAVLQGDVLIATMTLALVGSLVGFLRFNQAPAKIYLGDTGSMFIGFMLGALAMIGEYTHRSAIAALAPLLILGVAIFETCFLTATRVWNGYSPLAGSPDHFAIRLKARGWSARQVALAAYGLAVAGSAAGVAMVLSTAAIALLIVGAAALVGVVIALWLWARCPPPALPRP